MSSSTVDIDLCQSGHGGPPSPRRPTVVPANEVGGGNTAFGCARIFPNGNHVYLVLSPRARGLSIGINLSPDHACNFDCVYCEVAHTKRSTAACPDLTALARELEASLDLVHSGAIRDLPPFNRLQSSLLELRHVTVSGDGEPTLCPVFCEAIETINHVRTRGRVPFFRVVLLTNTAGLTRPETQRGLRQFLPLDEVWAKLDVGTQAAMDLVNRGDIPLEQVLHNILSLARQRPVVIQSLFTAINGRRLPDSEINEYARRLKSLKDQGARIPLVQIYSANRPSPGGHCEHLGLHELSAIAKTVRRIAGLRAEVF